MTEASESKKKPLKKAQHISDLDDQWLIRTHFFGIPQRTLEDGRLVLVNPKKPAEYIEPVVLQEAIDAAIDNLEDTLHVSIRTYEQRKEYHDFDRDIWNEYNQLVLDKYPVVKLHSLAIVHGEDEDAVRLWEIPDEMLQIKGKGRLYGTVEVLPHAGSFFGAEGVNPLLFSGVLNVHHAPSMFEVIYTAGLDGLPGDGDRKPIPANLIRAIGLMAAIHPLNILGDLAIGVGIASRSISFDGISHSVNTTASAENAAFSARIIQHHKELRGDNQVQGLIPSLQTKWRRQPFALL